MAYSHANRGMAAEEAVEWQCTFYANQKVALISKIDTPKKITATGAFYAGKSTPDFLGCWGGRPICFDVKSTKKAAFYLSDLPAHQKDYLDLWDATGGISFLLIFFEKLGLFFIAPNPLIQTRTKLEPQDLIEVRGTDFLRASEAADI